MLDVPSDLVALVAMLMSTVMLASVSSLTVSTIQPPGRFRVACCIWAPGPLVKVADGVCGVKS